MVLLATAAVTLHRADRRRETLEAKQGLHFSPTVTPYKVNDTARENWASLPLTRRHPS